MIFDLLYFINIILSLLVGFYLCTKLKPKHFKLHIFSLALYLIVNAICFSFYLLIKYEFILKIPYLYKTAAPLTYLIAPAAYFHVWFLVHKTSNLKWWHSLHLAPFVVFLVSYIPFYFDDLATKTSYVQRIIEDFNLTHTDNIGLIPEAFNSLGRILHPIFYLILQWILLKSKNAKLLKEKEKTLYTWAYHFVRIQTFLFASLLATVATSFLIFPELEDTIFSDISLLLTVIFFFVLSFYLFWNQKVLQKLKYFLPQADLSEETKALFSIEDITEIAYQQKLFLGEKSNSNDIAEYFEISKSDLSKIINTKYASFNAWINQLKIDQSIALIQKNFLTDFSVEALAKECGFNSRNTFYRAFKTATGTTPKEYIANSKKV